MSPLVEEIRVRQAVREECCHELRVARMLRRCMHHSIVRLPPPLAPTACTPGESPYVGIARTRLHKLGALKALEQTQRFLIALRKVRQRSRATTVTIPRTHL